MLFFPPWADEWMIILKKKKEKKTSGSNGESFRPLKHYFSVVLFFFFFLIALRKIEIFNNWSDVPFRVVWVPIFVKLRVNIFEMEFKIIIVSFIFMIIFNVAWTKLLVSTTTHVILKHCPYSAQILYINWNVHITHQWEGHWFLFKEKFKYQMVIFKE